MVTLTPQARAIAAFTLAALMLVGLMGRVTIAVISVFGDSFPSGRGGAFIAGLISIVFAVAVLALAMAAANGLTGGWELDLAQAARVLALIGVALAVVGTIGAVVTAGGFGLVGFPYGGFN